MRKSFISILLTTIVCVAAFSFIGCKKKKAEINTITDIQWYADMQPGGDKIYVNFDKGEQYGFKFVIEDKADIDEIVNLILTTPLTYAGDLPVPPGNNTTFMIYQGTRTYNFSFHGVKATDKDRYYFSTDDIKDKITSVAAEKGAFDVKVDDVK